MDIKLYQVDSFSSEIFSGNPAATCLLNEWLPEEIMQKIANENNLSETAFLKKQAEHYHIRWFTPTIEVDLCGHATLAAAHVLFEHEGFKRKEIIFSSKSGILAVRKEKELLYMNFPVDQIEKVDPPVELLNGLNNSPEEVFKGKTDYLVRLKNQQEVEKIKPNLFAWSKLDVRGIIITAKGIETDFVSRFFAPGAGINEDPVTGSAHTSLIPYWSNQLNKDEFLAAQLSTRKGLIYCKNKGNRVEIGGKAVTFLKGEIYLKNSLIQQF